MLPGRSRSRRHLQVGLETLLREVNKLAAVRALGLPAGLFTHASEKLLEAWRAPGGPLVPVGRARSARPVRLTLLAVLCWMGASRITDALVELLIGLIHRINARADRRVEREPIEDLRTPPSYGQRAAGRVRMQQPGSSRIRSGIHASVAVPPALDELVEGVVADAHTAERGGR